MSSPDNGPSYAAQQALVERLGDVARLPVPATAWGGELLSFRQP
ncbi:MAG TPA: hypothetical protein VLT87_01710 [Thermoanaerobaculia bacterium]|nr:hypothetical protein [Thermoanaerobaculia bacterium]